MPIYEYRCDNDHTFEAFQPMADDALDACEVCGAPAQRVLRAPAVHFKGSGFYSTDYGRKGQKPSGGDGGGESKGSDSSDKGSEKKSSEKQGDSSGSSSSKSESKSGSSKD